VGKQPERLHFLQTQLKQSAQADTTPRTVASKEQNKDTTIEAYIVIFVSPEDGCAVRVMARSKIEAAGRAYQSKAAQARLWGEWPRRCDLIELPSLPAA
jgi:hypothetical protein